MTQRFDQMLAGLTRDILAMAERAPLPVHRVEANLPTEFGLRLQGGAHLVATPPENLQARLLTPAPGQLRFALQIERARDV